MSIVIGVFISYKKSSRLHNEHGSSSETLTPSAIFSRDEFFRIFNARDSRDEILADIARCITG